MVQPGVNHLGNSSLLTSSVTDPGKAEVEAVMEKLKAEVGGVGQWDYRQQLSLLE